MRSIVYSFKMENLRLRAVKESAQPLSTGNEWRQDVNQGLTEFNKDFFKYIMILRGHSVRVAYTN